MAVYCCWKWAINAATSRGIADADKPFSLSRPAEYSGCAIISDGDMKNYVLKRLN